jgi:hypothetical protein
MGTATGEALAISVAELVQEDRVSGRTRLVHGDSTAKPHGTASRKELVSAIEEKHQQGNTYDARGSQRWRALDRLLCTSFATISPAYLFNSYLDIR